MNFCEEKYLVQHKNKVNNIPQQMALEEYAEVERLS